MHQKKNTEQEGEGWGTYYRVHLVDSCAQRVTKESPIKEWGGAPFAALKRAIRIIGCPRSGRIPKDMLEKLQILRDAYYGEEDREAQVAVEKEYGLDPFAEPDDDMDNLDDCGDDEGDNSDEEENEEDIEEESAPRRKKRKRAHLWKRGETPDQASFDYTN
ncbi:uncharacterized protein KD926_005685 [Aspergillus affinis]|uniref:uncharacterized protein n=1 Tax=Aspergillus affinis TaxID=1070780 RepID=UPI0022FE3E68|nr:uncharacterized protein KD926_005685 [Aspergillus affinis]KAI9042389.1 hypothetical protein KD926_005685 [Aspergillus affinis]